jgi:hypothetical protein
MPTERRKAPRVVWRDKDGIGVGFDPASDLKGTKHDR